jgi:hypothetical protein
MIELELSPQYPDVALRMPAVEASIPVARQAVRSLGEVLEADPSALDEAELAVTAGFADAGADRVRVWVRLDGGRLLADVGGVTRAEVALPKDLVGDLARAEAACERVVRRVTAMFAAGADLASDRLTEALLIGELLVRHAPRHLPGERLTMRLVTDGSALRMYIGPLQSGRTEVLLHDAGLPVAGSVIEHLADWVAVEPLGVNGRNPVEALIVEVGPTRAPRTRMPVAAPGHD